METYGVRVDGAELAYDVAGSGPVLALLGVPMGASGFRPLAERLVDRYTVVTYDPRGVDRSRRDEPGPAVTPDRCAADVVAVLDSAGVRSARIFASSGGAVTTLALCAARPDLVERAVLHEPPVVGALPEPFRTQAIGGMEDARRAYLDGGFELGMKAFRQLVDPGGTRNLDVYASTGPGGARSDYFLRELLDPIVHYEPDLVALRTLAGRLVPACGEDSAPDQPERATTEALAAAIGREVTTFPGGHLGFHEQPAASAELLHSLLAA